ncbi:MAG: HAD family hydrolase [Anaerolineae bacterium]|jgi:putative hydrolase of the HAD superfamily|nr:HAD family hydrolase [Anaerolineae bacterium]MBT7072128.1 HAD family hydrolase [Anaerolineae bacterium]MBT7326777.1 HAD family hydrolase [Anaerolineae bacterium]
MTPIRAVFFDLGKTLIYPKDIWQPVLLRSDKTLTEKLIANGVDVDPRTFPYEFIDRLNHYYADREGTLRETTTFRMLQHLLEEKGFRDVPAPTVRAALDAKYAITQSNWHLEADAHTALRALKLKGYQLALISNAGDDPDVQALLTTHQLNHFFSFIRSSAAAGYRKPHPHMFEEALKELGLFPEQCAMVGDTLEADIKGANALGIYSIWINRRVNQNTKTLVDIRPKAVIQELTELPKLLFEIS